PWCDAHRYRKVVPSSPAGNVRSYTSPACRKTKPLSNAPPSSVTVCPAALPTNTQRTLCPGSTRTERGLKKLSSTSTVTAPLGGGAGGGGAGGGGEVELPPPPPPQEARAKEKPANA